jgi:hypothetical protein
MERDNGDNPCPTQWESCRSHNENCEVVAIGAHVFIPQGGRVVVSPSALGASPGEHRTHEEQTELRTEQEEPTHWAFLGRGRGCLRMPMDFAREI